MLEGRYSLERLLRFCAHYFFCVGARRSRTLIGENPGRAQGAESLFLVAFSVGIEFDFTHV